MAYGRLVGLAMEETETKVVRWCLLPLSPMDATTGWLMPVMDASTGWFGGLMQDPGEMSECKLWIMVGLGFKHWILTVLGSGRRICQFRLLLFLLSSSSYLLVTSTSLFPPQLFLVSRQEGGGKKTGDLMIKNLVGRWPRRLTTTHPTTHPSELSLSAARSLLL